MNGIDRRTGARSSGGRGRVRGRGCPHERRRGPEPVPPPPGSLLALALLETSLRLFRNPFGFRVRGDQIVLPVHRRYEIHNTQIPKLDAVIIHTKNSLGFRGPEPPERFRIT